MLGVVRHYFEYFRRDFHPSQIDSEGLFRAWKEAYGESLVGPLRVTA
jgi:predicted metal-dependent hydrolase